MISSNRVPAAAREKKSREFHFHEADFEAVCKLLYKQAGISLNENKRDLVYGRLSRRLRALKIDSFEHYLGHLSSSEGVAERVHFVNALTTNLTAFFREPHHFDYLCKEVLPEAMRRHAGDRRVRMWSAGCSTGEEPYSIAMVVREQLPPKSTWDVKLLATDLDSEVVATAKRGVYSAERISGLPKPRIGKWFKNVGGGASAGVQASDTLQEMITFKQLNLMQEWPMRGPFDLIFCRNVVIYFDKPTQRKLFERYADILVEGGYLFLGHSESMHNVSERFELVGRTIYRKIG